MSNIKCAKLVVMGDISVGKSSLLTRYIKNTFDQFNESTIGAAFFTKIIEGESGEKVNLEIWDTAGQERYDSLLPMYYRGSNVIILVFDVNNPNTFENLKKRWLPIVNESSMKTLFFVVGNKTDLENKVSDEDVTNLIQDYGDIDYFKVSAKADTGLDELFRKVVTKVIECSAFKSIDNSNKFKIEVASKKKCC